MRMNPLKDNAVLLYSGGTDSTLSAVLLLEKVNTVHLLTFSRKGIFSAQNAELNAKKLMNKYPGRFVHKIIDVDKLFAFISYENYFRNLFRYGFFNLTTCGLCKLAMHLRAAIYCIDNQIDEIADGANNGMYMFPDQQRGYLDLLKEYYSKIGINYENPVFDFDAPSDIDFVDRFRLEEIPGLKDYDQSTKESRKKTTGYKLYELGIMPSENVKGTEMDRRMQPRCFQFVLFNIWLFWYYLPFKGMDDYRKEVLIFYRDKFERVFNMISEYKEKKEKSKIYKYI